MKKQCSRCKRDLPIEEFAWKNKAKGQRKARCRQCVKDYKDQHYQDNREDYVAKQAVRNNDLLEEVRLAICQYLIEHPCVDCGFDDIRALEFDHREDKLFTIAAHLNRKKITSVKKLMAEIKKCDVRCSNCHSIRTAVEQNSHRHRFVGGVAQPG